MKRGRDELEGSAEEGDQKRQEVAGEAAAQAEAAPAAGVQEDDEDDKPLVSNYKMSRSVRKGAECPYLDTISRQVPPPPSLLRCSLGLLLTRCPARSSGDAWTACDLGQRRGSCRRAPAELGL